jgi:DNA-directed RNA polymerase specialized sigma24 family protein
MALSLKESIARYHKAISDDQIIVGRSELLGRADRVLVRAVWVDNQSTRQVASLVGVTPSCVRQRIRRIVKHMHSEDFLAAARLLPELTGRHALVARLHFCQGLSCRAAADKAGIPYHEFRRLVDEVKGIMRLRQRRDRRRRGA